MAIKPDELFGNINPGNTTYPYGSAKNSSSPGVKDGTPITADLINDIWGVLQQLLQQAGITPSGSPDTAQSSQYYLALLQMAQQALSSTVSNLQSQINGNDNDINTNSNSIAANSNSIATNANNITTNANNITTNANRIATNAGAIVEAGLVFDDWQDDILSVASDWDHDGVKYRMSENGRYVQIRVIASVVVNPDDPILSYICRLPECAYPGETTYIGTAHCNTYSSCRPVYVGADGYINLVHKYNIDSANCFINAIYPTY